MTQREDLTAEWRKPAVVARYLDYLRGRGPIGRPERLNLASVIEALAERVAELEGDPKGTRAAFLERLNVGGKAHAIIEDLERTPPRSLIALAETHGVTANEIRRIWRNRVDLLERFPKAPNDA